MARDYSFSSNYTPEQAYAPPSATPFSRREWDRDRGGSLASSAPESALSQLSAAQEQPVGSRAGRIMDNMRAAESDAVQPNREGFRASSNAGRSFASANEALAQTQGSAAATALAGTGQALMQKSQGFADARLWEEQQQQAMRDYSEQQKAAKKKKKKGGLFGAIGGIVGSIFGGPVGGAIGGTLGGLIG
jgi:hypothetical protein